MRSLRRTDADPLRNKLHWRHSEDFGLPGPALQTDAYFPRGIGKIFKRISLLTYVPAQLRKAVGISRSAACSTYAHRRIMKYWLAAVSEQALFENLGYTDEFSNMIVAAKRMAFVTTSVHLSPDLVCSRNNFCSSGLAKSKYLPY